MPYNMLPKEILKKVKRLEIKTSRLVEGALAGSYLSTFKGRGMEFTEVREYTEGDDVRAIDWNVTARTAVPHVKTFMEERDLTVMLAVDLSGSMDFGTIAQSKRELAVEFAAAAALLAVKNNDRVGLLAFTDKVEAYVPPRKGKRHVMRLLATLSTINTHGRGADFSRAALYLMKTVKRRATLFWVSDFIGAPGPRPLKAISRRHELVPVVLKDRREAEVPPVGLMELVDPETKQRFMVDTSSEAFRAALDKERARAEGLMGSLWTALRSEPVSVWTGESPILPLARYFRRKARARRV
jgi:uncharacterized protein (DUF58 family)